MKDNLKQLGLKVPAQLLRRIDKAAKDSGRTRSSEVRMRLERSLREQASLPVKP